MIVEVTQDDIRLGKRLAPSQCPVALAVKRALGSGSWAAVEPACVEYRHWWWLWFHKKAMPPQASEFVLLFDLGYPVSPITFTL